MKKKIFRFLKHALLTLLFLFAVALVTGRIIGANVHYGDNPVALELNNEGPYVFVENDSTVSLNYLKGNRDEGYYADQKIFPADSPFRATCFFPLDSTRFEFIVKTEFETPQSIYEDEGKILAVSDIESGYKTFRDFLINNRVIDKALNWTFGNGHLVLVGDFVDRGFSTTHVLWFIYKLEQEAEKKGGQVHFILGNHEIKNLQANYESASPKYFHVASVMGKRQDELYNSQSVIGRWMASKNTVERINGHLFAHGGIHPELAEAGLSLETINRLNRKNYYKPFYPKTEESVEQLVIHSRKGPAWYRGYFKEDLEQEQIDHILESFQAKSITVGHTIQSKVKRKFEGKVIGIDVKHPKDYHRNWPSLSSEGLLIEGTAYYRVLDDGEKVEI